MRPIAAITGLAVALLVAACGTTAGSAPVPSAEPSATSGTPSTTPSGEPSAGELDVELVKGRGVVETEGGGWYVHGWNFDFAVEVTAPAAEVTEDRLTVVLTFPAPAMRVEKAEGDGWECSDVEAGISCAHDATATPGEAWPSLTVNAVATATTKGESLTVEASGPGRGTATVPLRLDTSS
jgi:hypothetical protein